MEKIPSVKERILDAAGEQFVRRGYAAVSVREIVEGLKISKGGFYHHFRSKESLFEAVVDRELSRWRESIAQVASERERSVSDRLHGLFLLPLSRSGAFYALFYEASRELNRAGTEEVIGEFLRCCEELILEGQKKGEIRDFLDRGTWAFQIVAAIEGAHVVAVFGGISGLEERLEQAYENTWRSIRAIVI